MYSPLTTELANSNHKDYKDDLFISNLFDESSINEKNKLRTIVAIEVQDFKNGAVHYWTLEKFQ